jgi:hypothetical protein
VVLTAPLEVIEERVIEREGSCSGDRLRFVAQADRIFRDSRLDVGQRIDFDTSIWSVEDIAEATKGAVGRLS